MAPTIDKLIIYNLSWRLKSLYKFSIRKNIINKDNRIIKFPFCLEISILLATIEHETAVIKIEFTKKSLLLFLLKTDIQKIDDNKIENINFIINDIILNITNFYFIPTSLKNLLKFKLKISKIFITANSGTPKTW